MTQIFLLMKFFLIFMFFKLKKSNNHQNQSIGRNTTLFNSLNKDHAYLQNIPIA